MFKTLSYAKPHVPNSQIKVNASKQRKISQAACKNGTLLRTLKFNWNSLKQTTRSKICALLSRRLIMLKTTLILIKLLCSNRTGSWKDKRNLSNGGISRSMHCKALSIKTIPTSHKYTRETIGSLVLNRSRRRAHSIKPFFSQRWSASLNLSKLGARRPPPPSDNLRNSRTTLRRCSTHPLPRRLTSSLRLWTTTSTVSWTLALRLVLVPRFNELSTLCD